MTQTSEFVFRQPKGGHLYHAVRVGGFTALCGYFPSSEGTYRMKDRSGWYAPDYLRVEPTCSKCKEKMDA
jgi:hypothetical protein